MQELYYLSFLLHPRLVHSDGFELRSNMSLILLPFPHCYLIVLNRLETVVLPSPFFRILDFWLNPLIGTPDSTIINGCNLVETFLYQHHTLLRDATHQRRKARKELFDSAFLMGLSLLLQT